MRLPVGLAVLAVLSGCTRDLELPPQPAPPGPGAVNGRVVIARPGRPDRQAAPGVVWR